MAFVIEEELRTALLAMSEVTDIVSTRIWDEWFRNDTYPSIVFEIDNERRENDLNGRGGMVFADVNVICRANTRAASRSLAEAVRVNGDVSPGSGLAGYSGNFDSWLEDQQMAAVPKNDKGNSHWYDTNMSFVVSWAEVV
jgi:hypothetical protein